jgi:hypothetical protein
MGCTIAFAALLWFIVLRKTVIPNQGSTNKLILDKSDISYLHLGQLFRLEILKEKITVQ